MLEEISSQWIQPRIYRLASIPLDEEKELEEFIEGLHLDALGIGELLTFLGRKAGNRNTEELLDAPFQTKIKFKTRTRFSDGSFPVFYSSLDAYTAQAEVKHWLPKFIGQAKETRKVYYRQFTCTFEGEEKDLRSKTTDWSNLINDNDYTFCNQIGAEAKKLNLDGIVTVSARHIGGDNLPVFSRSAIRDPELEVLLAMTFDPSTNQIEVEPLDE